MPPGGSIQIPGEREESLGRVLMSDSESFLHRVIAARRAAWIALLIAVGFQMLTYFAFLVMEGGGLTV